MEIKKLSNEVQLLKTKLKNEENNSIVEMTIEEKVKFYADYFKGRHDVYPYLSVNKNDSSIKYYIPACVNEWKQGVCNKTMGKPCKNCKYRENKPLTFETIKKHIYNNQTIVFILC